ncbi:putative LRR receptor-like serine/threonine-protein kinase At1g07650 [Silene latifolia]|uniref:putative LRR receptor-like serine/threonine-protein kinase At1g07650 n=1 Tax=Silene latifolia TaxID=37657 RepID=UPI003D76EF39
MAASFTVYIVFTVLVMWVLLTEFGSCSSDDCQGQLTAAHEVEALQEIAKELRKNDWNFKEDPCFKKTTYNSWFTRGDPANPNYVNQVSCGCIQGSWHLLNISLKGQNLDGILPKSLAKLTYLNTIDLSRNLLSGTIPEEWATMKLEYLSVMINRLSGHIPQYLGNISSLRYLSIESNSFSGTVPAELGKLVGLRNLTLTDNNLSGQLPIQLKKLANLTELRISSNSFNGTIPNYFKSWKNLQKLEIQGSGFEGPIPSSISLLVKLIELRISDLNGEGSLFPSIEKLTALTRLMLRSCKLHGPIPDYLVDMTELKVLDLSFNSLSGVIPDKLQYLSKMQYMYLTSNNLSGYIPSWITDSDDNSHFDLSYNNFSRSSTPSSCNRDTLNLYRSFSGDHDIKSSMCLKNFHCKARYSLHINCGGKETTVGKTSYEEDDEAGGSAKFVPKKAEWGFSSSGWFWFEKIPSNYLKEITSSPNTSNSSLYADARLSATSLTYYGSCLGKGNYSVKLHFSEIVFINNSFSGLGRRRFDIYIQEKLVHKNFDIVKEANGSNKAVVKVYPHIPVSGSIEIRFYYAGKGSTGIPVRGVYGPLISAISVESEFKPPFDVEKIKMILIIGASSLVCLLTFGFFIVWWKHHRKDTASREQVLAGLDLQTGLFTFRQLKAATNNFSDDSIIGHGGFGSVYLGILLDGTHIAVKQLSSRSKQGNREFINEIGMISGLNHPNLVRLYGCCVEGNQLFLIYEYMENNNLALALFDNIQLKLDWRTRQRICIGVARGLTFMHEESTIKIVHRDIKATNILLDGDLNAKIADFGLARLDEEEHTHISTRVAGTIGYMAPEYALWGYLTYKADVYSFGVLALEIVAGRSNTKFRPDDNYFCLLDWAFALQQQKGNLMDLVDPKMGSNYNKDEVLRMIKVALLCTNPSPTVRPTMSEVRSMLEGNMVVQELTLGPSMLQNDWLAQVSKKSQDMMSDRETISLVNSADPLMEED